MNPRFGHLVFILALGLLPTAGAGSAVPAWKGSFPSKGTGAELPVEVLLPEKEIPVTTPMVVYLKNLDRPRNSTVEDKTIVADLLRRGIAVAVVDYAGKPFLSDRHVLVDYGNLWKAFGGYRSPYISLVNERAYSIDVDALGLNYRAVQLSERKQVKRLVFQRDGSDAQAISETDIYVVPAGYTVHRRIRTVENGKVPDGHARHFFMDLVVPVKPKRPVPCILEPCTTVVRSESSATAINVNSPFPMSFTAHGYAYASTSFMYEVDEAGRPAWGLHSPDHKAIRLLRGKKEEWGLSGKVGVFGISKGAVSALFLAARRHGQKPVSVEPATLEKAPYQQLYGGQPHHESLEDLFRSLDLMETFREVAASGELVSPEGDMKDASVPEADPGPHADQSDRPDCGLAQSSGFDRHKLASVLPYLTADLPPMFLGYGLEEARSQLRRKSTRSIPFAFRSIRAILDDRGVSNYTYFEQEGLSHQFNYHRYADILVFADRYLKPSETP